jgi:tetratricopeptide (TPR) repeat protein
MWRHVVDRVLIGLVLVFAFLAASFAVRNSDFWLHLAGGRLLAEGRYQFGVDPFAFTTENHYWANHAWLFDWSLFLAYTRLGEVALVVLKALLISLLAFLLLRIRRADRGIAWPAACTLLAVLAMSPRLLLHSTCLSYVLLGTTLWLLWRPRKSMLNLGAQLAHYVPVLLLFILWVNVDGWFLLGPLLAGLFWLGDWIAPERTNAESTPRTPAWLWLAGLAVCLVNPHHIHAFALPVELIPLPAALQGDRRFETLQASPWQMGLYYHPFAGINWANGAYLVLLAAGGLPFLFNARRLSGWRLLVWLTFAGLSVWRARMIPFFAVVAAPITALNFQDAFQPISEGPARFRRFLVGISSFLLLIAALALSALAWPGWLQGFQDIGRHVDWSVQPDSSLKRAAERLSEWHSQDRGFLFHPSLVHYCAWFCPEEKGFLDQRLQLFHDVAGEYEQICQALNPGIGPKNHPPGGDWRSILRRHKITHLVLYDPSLARLAPALEQLAAPDGDWRLLEIDGQALLVGWRDDSRQLPERVPAFDAERLAFTTGREGKEDGILPAEAPERGPERAPLPGDFWSHFGKPIAPSPWESAAAGVLLHYFEDREPLEHQRRTERCFGWAAALPGLPALSVNSLDGPLRLAVAIAQAPPAPHDLTLQSPALPLLAIRTARAALGKNPDDASAYLSLVRAYLDLTGRTPEHIVFASLAPLAEMRHIQMAAALENALQRNPDSLLAHEQLAALFEARGFLDAALEHHRAALRLAQRAGPLPAEDSAAFARRMEQRERAVSALERLVNDRKNEFTLQTRDLGSEPLRKAEMALNQGLARLALDDILMASSILLLRGEGVCLQVRLQLLLGRIESVRAQLHDPDWKTNKAKLGSVTLFTPGDPTMPVYRLPCYEWLLLCQAAADGDYAQAEVALQDLIDGLGGARAAKEMRIYQQNLPLLVASELGWASQAQSWFMTRRTNQERLLQSQALTFFSHAAAQQVDLYVLVGMLALERGRPRDAEKSFHSATMLGRLVSGDRRSSPGLLLAEMYLRMLKAAER